MPLCITEFNFILVCQESELDRLTRAREAELKYIKEQNELEIVKARETV